MRNLKKQLVRLGYRRPEIQKNVRSILAYVNGDYGDQSLNRSFYPEEGHVPDFAIGVPAGPRQRKASFFRRRRASQKVTWKDLYEIFPNIEEYYDEREIEEIVHDLNQGTFPLEVMEELADAAGLSVAPLNLQTTDNDIYFIDTHDTYNLTLVYDGGLQEVIATTWADVAEAYERAYVLHNFREDGLVADEVFFAVELAPDARAEEVVKTFQREIKLGGELQWRPLDVTYDPEYNEVQCKGEVKVKTRELDNYFSMNGVYRGEAVNYRELTAFVKEGIETLVEQVIRRAGNPGYDIPHQEVESLDFNPETVYEPVFH